MKKSLIVLAVAGALSMGAQAATVEVYGLIDTSLVYMHTDADNGEKGKTDSLTMETAQQMGSRWGLRGSEDLGNGYKVGFTLESGFESDTGALEVKQGNRLFGREATINVSGNFGTVWAGRMPVFGSVLGPNGLFRAIDPITANYTSALGSGYATASMWTRVDNAIAYRTPTYAGFTGYMMHSFKMDDKAQDTNEQIEGKASADRYTSLALRYQAGALEGILVGDVTDWGNKLGANQKNRDDGYTMTIGGNYTFDGGLKVLAFYQYFDTMKLNANARGGVAKDGIMDIMQSSTDPLVRNIGYGYVDGWGMGVGVNYPVFGGTARFAVNHRQMDNEENVDFTRTTVGVTYDYPLSKSTWTYVMGGYSQEKVETKTEDRTPKGYQLSVGLVHKF